MYNIDSLGRNRITAILCVLRRTFVLNLVTAISKIVIGLQAGLLNVLADGIHSLSDAFVNVIGYISVSLSGKPPTDRHPYGHEKHETVATLVVACITFLLFVELLKAAVERLFHPEMVIVGPIVYAVMVGSVVLNLVTVVYEHGMGRKLNSEFLLADSKETGSDVFVSLGIIAALFLIDRGWMWVDGVVTLLISVIVLRNSWVVFRMASRILVDEAILDPEEVVDLVTSHSDVKWAHMVRSRGKNDAIYLDLHIGVPCHTTVEQAHDRISHEVKNLLLERFPDIKCVTTHIEPDNAAARRRENSVFRRRDY
jgi:cation diffusion facilitator family transporter